MDLLPIRVGGNGKSKRLVAHMVPKKGHDAHAVNTVGGEMCLSGQTSMVLKSDQEPSILAPLEAAKNERSEACKIMSASQKRGTKSFFLPNNHKLYQGERERYPISTRQVRTLRLCLQSRCRMKSKWTTQSCHGRCITRHR